MPQSYCGYEYILAFVHGTDRMKHVLVESRLEV
jgi:hypothetical protein